ncbi:7678_t:CDS:2 [Cetraspora pellucida]|uniref:7678_t:CDS:1 n=1 Tax=Cetraspora pellucida TaxID=1433469 RepID=A0ACA9L2Z9_9GLOM|nr:7678_t:CDS:2 [Cetraspora pellucida]
MVNGTQYVNQNYPAAIRNDITELNLSNKDLEGQLLLVNLGFNNLKKLNVSFNRLNDFTLPATLEEFDCSNNQILSFTDSLPKAIKFNISNNSMVSFSLSASFLSHLDVSINLLKTLDLRSIGGNIKELNCSNNPINSLSLNYSSDLNSFDCLGIKYNKFSTSPTQTSYSFITTTALANNSSLVGQEYLQHLRMANANAISAPNAGPHVNDD